MARSRRHKEKEKETERYYLLPGQGGKMYRKKQKKFIILSLFLAFFVAAIMWVIMYCTDRYSH